MRSILALLALSAVAFAADVQEVKGKASFEKLIKKNDFVVASFTAPWCGHCKKLKPEFEKAAASLKADGVILANVDATAKENEALAKKFKVQGYPTLFIFRNNDPEKAIEYEGPRDAAGIVSYLKRQTGPASKLVTDADAVKALLESETAVVGVFPGGEKSAEYKAYSEAANALRGDLELAHVTDGKLLGEHWDNGKVAKIFVFKTFDEPKLSLDVTSKSKSSDIEAFIAEALSPKVIELSQEPRFRKALNKMFEDQAAPKVLVFVTKDDETREPFRKAIIDAQAEHGEGYHFIMVVGSDNQGALNFFGVTAEDFPAIAIHSQQPEGKYIKKAVTVADVSGFVNDYKTGKVERHVKSEPVPESNDEPVKVVVATTFDELVLKSGKDVMLEAYAPWCGHCKKLVPIYDKVGEHFASDEGVRIAKIDATANDIPSERFEVKGFPTLYFYKHATDELLKYEGERSEGAIIDFIQKNRSGAKPAEEAHTGDEL